MQKNYQVIARKFRPKTFAEVVGQDPVVTTLKNALKQNRLGSAYLFCGSRGTGKTTLARLFAKALNCEHLTADCEPCNTCSSCKEIASGHSLNVLEIDGASNRGIDDIRQINETVGYAPSSGKYKIYLIDEVHMLTKEAFNALLKTLEEPPAHVKFFFATTEAHKVLPTIISRCQRFDLNPIPVPLIKEKLKAIVQELNASVEEEALTLIAAHAEGALRDAQSLLDQLLCYSDGRITAGNVCAALGLVPNALLFQLDKAIHKAYLPFAFELAEKIYSSGNEAAHFLQGLLEHFRTLLQVLLGGAPPNSDYRASAELYTRDQCLYILDYLIHWNQEMGRTPFKRVSLEVILLHLLRTRYRLSLDILTKRLLELDNKVPVQTEAPRPTLAPEPIPEPIKEVKEIVQEIVKDSPLPFEKKPKEHIVPAGLAPQTKFETLMRFAAVELEATFKKD